MFKKQVAVFFLSYIISMFEASLSFLKYSSLYEVFYADVKQLSRFLTSDLVLESLHDCFFSLLKNLVGSVVLV